MYFGEYCSGQGFGYSPINQMIYNLKKPMERRGQADWFYKERAIQSAAADFAQVLAQGFLDQAVLVAMPPSKARDDPRYDDRMMRMLQAIGAQRPCVVRDLLWQDGSREVAAHQGDRPDPGTLAGLLRVDERLCLPAPRAIGVFDDVLVTGSSFKAAKRVLQQRFPGVRVVGLYLARRVFPPPDFGFVEIEDD